MSPWPSQKKNFIMMLNDTPHKPHEGSRQGHPYEACGMLGTESPLSISLHSHYASVSFSNFVISDF